MHLEGSTLNSNYSIYLSSLSIFAKSTLLTSPDARETIASYNLPLESDTLTPFNSRKISADARAVLLLPSTNG